MSLVGLMQFVFSKPVWTVQALLASFARVTANSVNNGPILSKITVIASIIVTTNSPSPTPPITINPGSSFLTTSANPIATPA